MLSHYTRVIGGLVRTRGALLLAAGQIVVAPACGESTTGGNGTSASDAGGTSAASSNGTDGLADAAATEGSGSGTAASRSTAASTSAAGGAGGEASMTPVSASDGGTPSSGGGGGETPAGGNAGGSAGQATTTVTATTGMVCKNGGADFEFCLTREQMEEQARYGYELTPRDPPRTDEEIAAAWDDQGCLPAYWVGSSNCNPGVTPGRRSGDQCCYTSCEGELCCGGGVCGLSITGTTGSR